MSLSCSTFVARAGVWLLSRSLTGGRLLVVTLWRGVYLPVGRDAESREVLDLSIVRPCHRGEGRSLEGRYGL